MEATPRKPFSQGLLDVGDGHVLFYEQLGNVEGTPVVYLHGGPGSGCTPGVRTLFDESRHHAVLFDQRASGRSTPHASTDAVDWNSIDIAHHVSDIAPDSGRCRVGVVTIAPRRPVARSVGDLRF